MDALSSGPGKSNTPAIYSSLQYLVRDLARYSTYSTSSHRPVIKTSHRRHYHRHYHHRRLRRTDARRLSTNYDTKVSPRGCQDQLLQHSLSSIRKARTLGGRNVGTRVSPNQASLADWRWNGATISHAMGSLAKARYKDLVRCWMSCLTTTISFTTTSSTTVATSLHSNDSYCFRRLRHPRRETASRSHQNPPNIDPSLSDSKSISSSYSTRVSSNRFIHIPSLFDQSYTRSDYEDGV